MSGKEETMAQQGAAEQQKPEVAKPAQPVAFSAQEDDESEAFSPQKLLNPKNHVQKDWRFPSTNITKHCWARYEEFHKCIKERADGEEDPQCKWFAHAYKELCPTEWVERWDELREEGAWPGKY
ncbi:unnamed protein product [Pedinophyceae sp. YPF-701]|nr:unnamed protein product [Pedinophyceae sp. YPF-701]